MAEKKSWRDYSKNYSTEDSTDESNEESTGSKKTGSWRDYSESYSGTKETKSAKSTGSWRDYSTFDTGSAVGNNVTNQVNSWLQKHNSYISEYQKRNANRKYTYEDSYMDDYDSWLETVTNQRTELESEANSILSYLHQNEKYLDADFVKKISKAITDAKNDQKIVVEGSTADKEWWSNFGTEELVNEYGSAEDAYKYYQRDDGYRKKYNGKTYSDLQSLLDGMEDGEEKDWLTSYASSVDYEEKSKLDLSAAENEIAAIEAEIQELDNYFYESRYSLLDYLPGTYEYDAQVAKLYGKYGGSAEAMEKYILDKQKQLEEKQKRLDSARSIQNLIAWNSVSGNADFGQNSQYVSNVEYGLFGKPTFTDDTYAYINNPTVEDKRPLGAGEAKARELISWNDDIYKSDTPLRNRDSSYEREALDNISADEIAIYNYYYATQGPEKARQYLDLLVDTFQARKDAKTAENVSKFASEHPWIASALSIGTSIGSGFEYIGDVIEYAGDKLLGNDAKLDRNESALVTNAVRGSVAEKVDWEIGNWDAFDFLYNTTMSGIDSLASTAFGGFGGAVLGLSAAAQATNDALDRGMSDGQAFWNGIFSGVFEGLFESVSIGQFNALKEVAPKKVKDIFKNLGKSMLVNASEETLTEIANIGYDTLVNGEFANYTLEELANGAWKEALGQVLEAGASGALMGVGMGGIASVSGYASNKKADSTALKKYGDKTDMLIQEGLQSDVKSESYKLAQEYKQQIDGGKALTGEQIRNLLAANQDQITPKDLQKIKKAAEKRLTDLGQTEDVGKIAELVTKRATGQKMSDLEKSVLARSQFGAQVAKEMREAEQPKNGTESFDVAYKSLESRMKAETPEQASNVNVQVSSTGKAVIRATGEVVDLTAPTFKQITEDRVVLEANGKTVRSNDIDYDSEDQGLAINSIGKIEHITPAAAGALYAKLDMTKPVMAQLNGMDEAFTYGFYNYPEADLKAGLFTGNLTKEQLNDSYKLGQYVAKNTVTNDNAGIKKMRTAADAIAEKAAKEGKKAPKSKNLTITYNHGGGVVETINTAKDLGELNDEQRGGFEAAELLHMMGLGTDFELFASKTVMDEDGNPVEVFINDEGQEEAAYAGVYLAADGKIRINLNAYSGTNGLVLNALAHELVHFIKTWSLEKYTAMAKFLTDAYGESGMTMHQRVLREQARLKGIRGKEVSYGEAYDEVVANALNRMFDDGKVLEKLNELTAKDKGLLKKILEGIKRFFKRFTKVYQNNQSLFHDTEDLMKMKEVFEQLQNVFAEALVDASANFQAAQQVGFVLDTQTESVTPAVAMKSENTWKQSDYVQERDKAAKEIAKAIGVSEKKAKDYIDSINSIAKMIAEDRSRLDYFSSSGRTSFVGNVEYGGSFDFSTLCKKRRLLTGTFTAIQKALPNTALTADEILDIRNRMKEANLEVSCGLCYVEGSRANMGQFAKEFIRLYKQYYPDAWQPNMADVNTPDGIEWVRINHPECYEQYEYFWNHYGTLKDGDKNLFASQQKPKLYQLHTEYKGEILDKFKGDDNVEEKNLNGGIRLQSFSDFEIVHLIDTMQIIMDMSRVGLAGQAYTKVPDFAWALGDTGLKINLSLIAKGVDADGKLIFDDVEGMPIAEAMKLRDRYSKNVGTILVAFNDEQLLAAMADDRVDFIIPFHRSQWKKSQYEAMGLPAKTKDYTFMQNEKYIKPQFHEYRGRMVKDKATNYMPNEYWDFSKSGKENAEIYLDMCARNNKRPKFYKLLQNNGDGSYSLKADGSTDGYWKLLIDFKMYDNDGNGSPQMAVKPEFNMEEANRMLNDYKGGHSNFPVAQGIVDGFVKDYKASHKGVQYSSQQTDLSVKDVVKNKSGTVAVNIDSKKSGLIAHKKGDWPSVIANQIRTTLSGKSIYAADGDIITVTNRGAREVAYGTDSIDLRNEAKESKNYEAVERKMFTAEHAASIISLSVYKSWSENTENLNDRFKKDGLNHRYVNLWIDGELYEATVLTALSADEKDIRNYGEKFYDIVSIKKQTNQSATSGDTNMASIPHKIKFADDSSDRLTISQKQRIVNRKNATYSTGGSGAKTAMAEAFSRAKELKSTQQTDNITDRDMLANAFETISKNSTEYEMIQDYKSNVDRLNKLERELDDVNREIRSIRFGTGKKDHQRLELLESKAKQLRKDITKYDKQLLDMEASAPLRKVIQEERKKEAQKTKDHVKEIQQNKKVRAEQTELRHKVRKAIRDLDKILNRGNKQRNVKEDLQPVVTKALQAAEILFTDNYGSYDMLRNGLGVDLSDSEEALVESCAKMLKDLDKMPTDGYENWQARQEAENRLRTKMSKLKEVFARERKRLNNTTVSGILGELADAYAGLEESELSYVQGAYSEPVHNFLKNLQNEVGGTIVSDMTKNQLESVYAAYQMVLTTVRKANELFNEELKQSREQLGNAVIEEVLKAGGVHLLGTKIGDEISQFDWNNMKPVWVANRIGSETFGKLMKGLFKGQYNFAVDIDEAKQFKLNMDEKYHPREWDAEKLYEFESSTGKKFSLNLQQIMSLYAFSKREQAYSHLLSGGFVFEDNSTVVVDGKLGIKRTYIHKGAASYKLNEATLNGIINSLTAEQKAYVDEMQKYLSDVMGAKGNEVSMQLYGIQMFKEKSYFPLRSSGAYMERAKEAEMKQQQGQINLVNSGFTHAVKPQAKNPIILSGFMDVWAEHCNEMSMYHSMVLPMEDFRKVYNYSTVHDEKMESASVYQTIQDAYGKAATNYIDQLYRELNAGATVDPRETPWKTFISNFKKAAVMLSGSVVVQQFSSIGRAYAVIDPKYFAGAKVNSDTQLSTVDEMKKYAPVAIIKEMGGFDTGTKGSAKSYIMAETYGKGERIKGLKKDKQYRGDIMGYLPAKADEITWCSIWEAVKRETKAKNPKMDIKSEEFLKLAGDRFSEVIEKTQVYDSVLARSANMRSKGNFMAMATAFMAEPTTTINLIEDAIRRGDKKYLARTFGAVAVSIVLNNALASIVYAMRDDDEDETFIEKYFQSFTSGMIDDINPMSYYPFLKDIYSLFQGYDVERTDMAVFADVRDALKKAVSLLGKDTSDMDDDELAEHNKQVNDVFMSILDAGFSAFGVPVKNVRRDGVAIINGIKTIGEDLSGERSTTWNSFWDKVGAAVKDTIPTPLSMPLYAWTKDQAKTDKLYTAIISGDKAYLDRLKSTYKTEDAYQSAVCKALRENDSRIHAAAQAGYEGNSAERNRIYQEIKKEGKFAPNLIIDAINSELNAIRNKLEPDKVTGNYEAYDFVEAVSAGDASTANTVRGDIISTYVANGKTQSEAEKTFVSDVKSSIKEAYSYGALDKATAENILVDYADMDDEDAKDRVTYWDFCKENPNSDLSESKALKYLEFAEPAAISLDVYKQFVNGTKDLSDIKDEWGDVEVSKREQVLEVIDSLDLTWQQKDALYLAAGYSEDKIWDVPW